MRAQRVAAATAAASIALAAACAPRASSGGGLDRPVADPTIEIPSRLHASADAWNDGNLSGFLAPYLDAPETTFIGGSGLVHGLDEVRAGYQESYWSSGQPAQSLSFSNITVQPLGHSHALAVGRYVLTDPDTGDTAGTGFFSLVWRNTADYGWQIIHDHSSAGSSP